MPVETIWKWYLQRFYVILYSYLNSVAPFFFEIARQLHEVEPQFYNYFGDFEENRIEDSYEEITKKTPQYIKILSYLFNFNYRYLCPLHPCL